MVAPLTGSPQPAPVRRASSIACFCSNVSAVPVGSYDTAWGPVRIVRCLACGACRADEVADEPTMAEMYDESSIYRAPTEEEFGAKAASFEHVLRDLDAAGIRRGRVLDIGCNAGYALVPFQRAGWEVWGVERNRETSAYARARIGPTVVDDLAALPPGVEFDVVILSHIVEHIADPVAFLSATREWMRPEGVVVVKVPNYGSVLVRRFIGSRWSGFLPRQHIWYFDRRSLVRLLEIARFRPVRAYSRGHLGVRSRTFLRTVLKAPVAWIHRRLRYDGEELVGIFTAHR